MGGGPSAEEKRLQKELEDRNRQQQAMQTQFINLAAAPDPLVTRLRDRDIAFLDWADQKDAQGNAAPLDVRRAPGLGPSLGLYESARRGQQQERQGIGALRMGAQGSDPNLTSLLREQSQAHREQEAAGGLERAVAARQAEATGSILPLASLEQNKRMGLASLASGSASDVLGNLTQFTGRQRRRPFWQDLALAGWSSGANLASGGMGG